MDKLKIDNDFGDGLIAFGDQISSETRNVKRSLLAVGGLAIITDTYELNINPSWIESDFPTLEPEILNGLLGTILAYLLCSFFLYAYQDVKIWLIARYDKTARSCFDLLLHTMPQVCGYLNLYQQLKLMERP